MIELTPGKLWGMRRMANADGYFMITAVDQRPPITAPIAKYHGAKKAPYAEVARFKALLIETLQNDSSAMLLDPHFAIPRGLKYFSPQNGLIVTLEDSLFRDGGKGRFSCAIDDWSVAKIKRMGGDAVKVLAWYRPDADEAINRHQQNFVRKIGEACAHYDIPFLFELLVFPLNEDAGQTREYVEMAGKKADHVLASVREFAKPEYGIDVFKLESPVASGRVPGVEGENWKETQAVFDEMGRLAGRPWVMLSAGAGKDDFRRILTHAYMAGASGYLAGRAIWLDAFQKFPDWRAIRRELITGARPYMADLNSLTQANALPWHKHACFGGNGLNFTPSDASFRHAYEAI